MKRKKKQHVDVSKIKLQENEKKREEKSLYQQQQ